VPIEAPGRALDERAAARWRAATFALCVGAALRMLVVVAPTPMYGYANNYDFVRVSAWFDLWPVAPPGEASFDPRAQHPRAPLRCYRIDPGVASDIRYPTTELAFVWLALRVNDAWRTLGGPSACALDLRVLGLLRAALLLAAGVVVTVAFLRRAPRAGFVSALILAGVLADPAVVLLFNTLYSEFSTVLLTYLAVAQIVYVLGFACFGPATGVLLGATLLALAGTKTQYAGLSLVLASLLALAAVAPRWRRVPGRARAWTVGLALLGAAAGLVAQQRAVAGGGYMWSMRMGAATDAFFGAILPRHRDPARALSLLGLPERCRPYVGKTWYDEGMQPPPCPEVAAVSRLRVVRLVLDDPGLAWRLVRDALPLLRPLIVRYYGQVEGGDLAQADARGRRGVVSVSPLLEALPAWLLGVLIAGTLVAGVVAVADVARPPGASDAPRGALLPVLVASSALVEAYAFASSLIGAGFIDLARHALVGQLAFLVLLPAGAALLARAVRPDGSAGTRPDAAAGHCSL